MHMKCTALQSKGGSLYGGPYLLPPPPGGTLPVQVPRHHSIQGFERRHRELQQCCRGVAQPVSFAPCRPIATRPVPPLVVGYPDMAQARRAGGVAEMQQHRHHFRYSRFLGAVLWALN
jgi:hypothetical protein